MSLGLVGRKVGMTRIFTGDGDSQPVTVLDVSNNRVTQIKTPATDGYSAVQVTFGKRRAIRVNKPSAGHFAKAAVEAGHVLKEFRVTPEALGNLCAWCCHRSGHIPARAEGGCDRHFDRQRLQRCHQAAWFFVEPRQSW